MVKAILKKQVINGREVDVVHRPILNTPYESPEFHWELEEQTFRARNVVMEGRRPSGAYLPVPKAGDGTLLGASTSINVEPHATINELRECVAEWRKEGWPGATHVTRELLDYWSGSEIVTMRPFFCQVEAMETVVWLHEAGRRADHGHWKKITDQLVKVNEEYNEGINRVALKLATGAGKTMLMKMIISWMTLNKRRVAFLAITPGITVMERLRELKPSYGGYNELLPKNHRNSINQASVVILNYQSFTQRNMLFVDGETDVLSGTGGKLLGPQSVIRETELQMLRRLLRTNRKIVVFNDEAHHCYKPMLRRTRGEEGQYEKTASIWFGVLKSLNHTETRRLARVYDLSATPMFLRVPASVQSELFPWTVSDYPLIEAVEAGLTKIPQVPTEDDTDKADSTYRNLYENTEPKLLAYPKLTKTVSSLLEEIKEHYKIVKTKYKGLKRVPVFIIVANSRDNARTLYRHIAGDYIDGKWMPGTLDDFEDFSNIENGRNRPKSNPPTLLVHSNLDDKELSEGLNLDSLWKVHTPGIKNKKNRWSKIREIFNTVGIEGRPGEHIRCIISVSMLTEGWDARTVSHIMGYRKFGSQLLCEQVVGRGLRRTSFDCNEEGSDYLLPEFVNVFGVPFNFMASSGQIPNYIPNEWYHVYSMPERAERHRVCFPNIVSYLLEEPETKFIFCNDKVEKIEIKPRRVPSVTKILGIVGQSHDFKLIEKRRRCILYIIAAELIQMHKLPGISRRRELFSSALRVVEEWLSHPNVYCEDPRYILEESNLQPALENIINSCKHVSEDLAIAPVFADEEDPCQPRLLDTGDVDYMTGVSPFHDTSSSEINRAPCDSNPEVIVARALDEISEISGWVRNHRLEWKIPYFDPRKSVWRQYVPDFVARVNRGKNESPLTLVIEYKGIVGEDSDIKMNGVVNWWLPAVNNSVDDACVGDWKYVFLDKVDTIHSSIKKAVRT